MNTEREAIRRVIAQTFAVDLDAVPDAAGAEDVDGWDSLSHTVLMIRLQNAFKIRIPESLAADAANVGDLITGIEGLVTSTHGAQAS
ncbi:acyl carrier protein [Methylobacterium haplocladii]|uniref:Carrier domain-containing protein n=1 Tax=Methylobacterium haplocladii TaxID=1176176 RepID=A0A512IPG0_9HYPH|nr:acyl carrier protein [Methylobacterium haplocladii]GEO99587.1 hypothetical protein MHA02_19750 [Methylobacterium haplocladii]GJD85878.1 Acyl carrier protein [Methylobacterium haplocladii]GLS58563.1 hypothetical protein GCM10007887_12270 [Methylobacterium haplocladii]